jgi:hypothetical protein
VQGSFAPAGATSGSAPWTPATFEKAAKAFNRISFYIFSGHRSELWIFGIQNWIAPVGHCFAHSPQFTHSAESIDARLFITLAAPLGQDFSHFLHPIHPALQTFLVYAPLSQLEQATKALAVAGIISIKWFGHCFAHIPHPTHKVLSTTAISFSIEIAPY